MSDLTFAQMKAMRNIPACPYCGSKEGDPKGCHACEALYLALRRERLFEAMWGAEKKRINDQEEPLRDET